MPARHPFLFVATLLAAGAPRLAAAHHAMGGAAPRTAWEGLASGLAHPVIGLDHLAFLVAAGILAAGAGRAGAGLLLAFLAAGLGGSLLHLAGIGLGPVELVIAASLLAVGTALFRAGRAVAPFPVLAGLFAGAGLFHGHAFAEAAIGAQTGPVLAYLLGLAAVQGAIGYGVMALAPRLADGQLRRWAGAAACMAGFVAGVLALTG
jgi:urease accessory protein